MEDVTPLHLCKIKPGEEPAVPLNEYLLKYLKHNAKHVQGPAQVDVRDGSALSFPELLEQAVRAAAGWRALGLKRGDRLAVYSRNRAEVFPATLGAFFEALTVVLTVPHARQQELRHCLAHVPPKAMLSEPSLLENALAETAPGTIHVVMGPKPKGRPDVLTLHEVLQKGDALGLRPDTYRVAAVPDPAEHVAVITYSSGTSGLKKALQLSDKSLSVLCHDTTAVWRVLPGERALITHPLSWGTGLTTAKMCLVAGSTAVYTNYVDDPQILDELVRFKITNWMTAPARLLTLAHLVVDLRERQGKTVDLSNLRYLKCCGGPLGPQAQAFIQDTMGVQVLQTYGTIEVYHLSSTPVTSVETPNFEFCAPGSAGRISPGNKIRLVDTVTGKDVEGPGVRGEIRAKTLYHMKGYINVPESPWDDQGYYITGDVGYLDEKGQLFIVDRIKELIIYDEFHVAPAELEAVLASHPAVKEACVVGRKHPVLDELPTAFVVLRAGAKATAQELKDLIKGRLTASKQLRGGVFFVDEIPKSLYGKVLRSKLKEKFAELPPLNDAELMRER